MTEHGSMLSSPDLSEALKEVAAVRLTFRQVYDTYFAFVWRAAANRGVPDAAMDDVVQEVFLVVHRKLPEFEGRSTLRTWLSGVVRRVVADHVKKRGNQAAGQETLDDHAFESAENPADDLERRAAVEIVDTLLQKLGDAHREVFVMYELEQLTTREIAELTRTNENTVQTRLKAARKIFQRGLERYRASAARRDT
ncbi:MAG TPA: sigma-70 family RNA polymerase sigma factor [Polyangiaceae bacterium]|jgi:RNA polymerase sigma-70 factor (ECF subfamily)|nr:sigma-70 family RNA polymerase sigma factor [Polyangiaceae bacterium]